MKITYKQARESLRNHGQGPILPGNIVDIDTPDGWDEEDYERRVRRMLVRRGDCRIAHPGGYLVARAAL